MTTCAACGSANPQWSNDENDETRICSGRECLLAALASEGRWPLRNVGGWIKGRRIA